MKQTIATGTAIRDTTRRMLATAGFWLAVSVAPATAGDRALIDFIGYSHEIGNFAFQEYGVQDGTNLAYSSIRIVDLANGRLVDAFLHR